MTTIAVRLDDRAEQDLRDLCSREGSDVEDTASRLLARAIRAAKGRHTFDPEELRRRYAEFAEEDAALADSGINERANLLSLEDMA